MFSEYRRQILDLHRQTKLNHLEVRHEIGGPAGEELYTDYFFTSEKREVCLVHLSGVHGVEGYLGSLIQQEILKQNLSDLPFQLVIVHTVNPFGMAARLRTNAANVDLNRNALKAYQIQNPHFHHFKNFLSSGSFLDLVATIPTIFKLGVKETARTVACGQTEYADSLFYCGAELQPELVSLRKNLELLIDDQTFIFALDVHTGLGKFGDEALIAEGFSLEDSRKFQKVFGKQLTIPEVTPGFLHSEGTVAQLIRQKWRALHCFQEFGTKPFYQVLRALIKKDPNLIHQVFFPESPQWKKQCTDLGVQRFHQLKTHFSKTTTI